MKRIELIDEETGCRAVAQLHEDDAPETVAGIWASLATPLRRPALHAKTHGRQIFLEIPAEQAQFDGASLPPENQTITPLPGEIGFLYQRPHALINNQRPGDVDRASAIYDIPIFYGRDCMTWTSIGWVPVNIWATITDGLPEFAQFAERIRSQGQKMITIRRLAED